MADNVATLTSAINTAVANLAGKDEIPEAARYQLLEAIDKLRVAVEPPLLTIRNFCFGVSNSLGSFYHPFNLFVAILM